MVATERSRRFSRPGPLETAALQPLGELGYGDSEGLRDLNPGPARGEHRMVGIDAGDARQTGEGVNASRQTPDVSGAGPPVAEARYLSVRGSEVLRHSQSRQQAPASQSSGVDLDGYLPAAVGVLLQ